MKYSDNIEKNRSLEVAEEARQEAWLSRSFAADLFHGNCCWDLICPYPTQSAEDKAIGDQLLNKLEPVLRQYIAPDEIDRTGEIPEEALQALARLGCFGLKIPRQYGGLGLSQTNYNRVIAMVASHCASTAVLLSAHQSIGVPQPLKMFGTEEQKNKYLPRLAAGAISAFALTEPGVGSDPARMITHAEPSEDGTYFTLNGLKMWCTNGPIADILVVMARTPSITVKGREKQQISAFIVERDMPGFHVKHRCRFMGLNGIQNGMISFQDVRVPRENLIGETGKGLKIALATLNTGRLTLPAASSAINKLCLKYSRSWATERSQWGCPIGQHESIASLLAEMAADTFACESVSNLAAALADRGTVDIRLEAAIAKYFCTEVAWKTADNALQIRGGRGYETAESLRHRRENPMPLERILRDCRINRIIEGTSEIMRLFIAREALDLHMTRATKLLDTRVGLVQKLGVLLRSAAFYSWWYPTRWLPRGHTLPGVDRQLRRHAQFVAGASRRLARALFHSMGRHQRKLEQEQLLLSCYVDIGTDLFAMSACLSHAKHLCAEQGTVGSAHLADLFCTYARDRITANFARARKSRALMRQVSSELLASEYRWLECDIVGAHPHHAGTQTELPPDATPEPVLATTTAT